MKKYFFAVSAFAIMSANAQAADVVSYQAATPATVSGYNWSGFYAGGQIGGSWNKVKANGKEIDEDGIEEPFRLKKNLDGFIGGLYAGYNFDLGNKVVLGLESDFIWGDVNKKYKETDEDGEVDTYKIKQKWQGATRVRAGYAFDRFLPYLAGGVAYSKYEESGDKIGTFTGWTIGTGVDYALTDNILLRAEYRYSDFGHKTIKDEDFRSKISAKSNDICLGVAYKF